MYTESTLDKKSTLVRVPALTHSKQEVYVLHKNNLLVQIPEGQQGNVYTVVTNRVVV